MQTPKYVPGVRAFSRGLAAAIVLFIAACGEREATIGIGAPVIGQRIGFGQGGTSEQYRVSGWSKTEEKFTWSEGTSAKLSLPIGDVTGPLLLKITMGGLMHPPDLPAQPVEVYANDTKIADWQVGNTAEFAATIPGNANKGGGKVDIEFRVPKATTPKSIGQNDDPRRLGICVTALELTKA
jgi:hypothetical protein